MVGGALPLVFPVDRWGGAGAMPALEHELRFGAHPAFHLIAQEYFIGHSVEHLTYTQ